MRGDTPIPDPQSCPRKARRSHETFDFVRFVCFVPFERRTLSLKPGEPPCPPRTAVHHRFPLTKRAPRQGKLATRLRGCCQKASGMSLRESIRSCSFEVYLRTLGDDSAVFPNVERRSVHSRGTPRRFPGTHQRSSHTGGKLRVPVRGLRDCLAFHGPDLSGSAAGQSHCLRGRESSEYVQ